MRQAIAQVRLIIEQHGESRFQPVDDSTKPVLNQLGWRKGHGAEREWLIPSETWKSEICGGLDPKFVARTLADAGMLERASDGNQQVRKIGGVNKRVFVIKAEVIDGGGNAS